MIRPFPTRPFDAADPETGDSDDPPDHGKPDGGEEDAVALLQRIRGVPYTYGGDEHAGWLPAGAAKPLPTPVVHVTVDLEIESDGDGFLLLGRAREDSHVRVDQWFDSLLEAEESAEARFGVRPEQWETLPPTDG